MAFNGVVSNNVWHEASQPVGYGAVPNGRKIFGFFDNQTDGPVDVSTHAVQQPQEGDL